MELDHSFTVPVPVDDAWKVLLDVERVAPCMPGATLESIDGNDFTGRVRVKVGPISLTYKGAAKFASIDEATHKAVIEASGKDTQGSSTAAATVTAQLSEQDGATRVDVQTDLNVTGKPAQFGRGVLADVGAKLIGQFADCLAGKIAAGDVGAAAEGAPGTDGAAEDGTPGGGVATDGQATIAADSSAGAPSQTAGAATASLATDPGPGAGTQADAGQPAITGPRFVAPADEAEPIDLLSTAGGPVLKRLAPVLVAVVALVALVAILRRHRG
jgi:uncharacterized protein